jgi:SAM-dependent methyltransferase
MFTEPTRCLFCYSSGASIENSDAIHPRVTGFGPFTTYICSYCGSFFTYPAPSKEQIVDFYTKSARGISPELRDSRIHNPQTAWYQKCFREIAKSIHLNNNEIEWLELGSGDGELAQIVGRNWAHGKGVCIDLHSKPARIKNLDNVDWSQHDLNVGVPEKFHHKFDLAFSISVIEHVLDPELFLTSLIKTVRDKGVVVVVGPDFGSFFAKIMGRRWPYYLPGEHLHIPTREGLARLMERLVSRVGPVKYSTSSIWIPYSIGYIAEFYKMRLFDTIPGNWAVSVPAGAFILRVTKG